MASKEVSESGDETSVSEPRSKLQVALTTYTVGCMVSLIWIESLAGQVYNDSL